MKSKCNCNPRIASHWPTCPQYENPCTEQPEPRKCKICGCDDDHACEGGCDWVDIDLCSKCKPAENKEWEKEFGYIIGRYYPLAEASGLNTFLDKITPGINKIISTQIYQAEARGYEKGYKDAKTKALEDITENYTPNEINRKVRIG